MGLQPTKDTVSQGVAVWSTVLETAIGGFTLDKTGFSDGDVVAPGQPIGYDESTRIAKVIKTATLQADAGNTDVAYKVKKGHNIKVGEYIGAVKGAKAYAVSAIDYSNADYDSITVETTLGAALTAGTSLFQSSATGATAAALFVAPKGLLYEGINVGDQDSVSVVLRGTLYARRAAVANADLQAALPLIIFSQSY